MEPLTNLRQSQPAAMHLDWCRHYLQIAQSANTPKELAHALTQAADQRRWAIREYCQHVRVEKAWAILDAIRPTLTRPEWIRVRDLPITAILDAGFPAEAIRSQGETLRRYLATKSEVA